MSAVNQLGKYQAYPEYKNSGVEWLGEVPSDWVLQRLKFLCHITTGDKDTVEREEEGLYPFFVRSDTVERISTYSFDGEAVLTAGDGAIGKIFHHINGKFDFHQRVYKFSDFKYVNGRYFYHYISNNLANEVIKLSAKTTVDSLRLPMLQNFVFVLPPIEHQVTIAAFLDYETARIDQLIAKQQQLIELLKEKRQAVISHAVTKGLNPNAPMKDSGVEWLGQVSEHWSTNRIGWSCRVGNGCTPNRDNSAYWENGTFPWLNSGKVNDIRIVSAEQFVTKTAMSECSLPRVPAGSILMAITGEGKTRGSVAITSIEATLSQHLAYITVTSKKLFPAYLFLWLESQYEKIRFISEGWGSTKAAITCGDINSYPFPEPPIHEQEIIVNYVENQKNQFDYLIEKSMLMIKHLQERRTALISAAVTGKIDLRGWQPPKREVAA
ncbi:hypothetical protein B6I54_27175 [Klebsiella pneumoniae]|uniref:restriction endonuclease subunit S n=1 Tax=Klebsiella pneumoniae TaxID=573 RepID=UPI000C7B3A76|nr:restriction endonuclease subunit S [Klebsiella pneumoniae]PLD54249.1 hypothetical protein B6I54_27175 [Klebsiella pneumoniae]